MSGIQVSMLLPFILNVLLVYIVIKVSDAVNTNADILSTVIKGFDESQKQVQRLIDHYNSTVDILNSCITVIDEITNFCETLGVELQYDELDKDRLQKELDEFRKNTAILYEDKKIEEDK